MPNMIPVESTNLASVGYDPLPRTLYVTFHSGSTYAYFGVPESVYRELMQADSKGRFLNQFIKNSYRYQRL